MGGWAGRCIRKGFDRSSSKLKCEQMHGVNVEITRAVIEDNIDEYVCASANVCGIFLS